MVKQRQERTTAKQQRPAPVLRLTVIVKGRPYECLIDLYDAAAPVLVASASQPGFYKLYREDGLLVCTCPAFTWRRYCNHFAAAAMALSNATEAIAQARGARYEQEGTA